MIFLLLIIFQLKHFLADYPLQGKYMLGKFKRYPDFVLPLVCHVLVHGTFTFFISLIFVSWKESLILGFLDMSFHSFIDFVKANPDLGGRFQALTKKDFVNGAVTQNEIKSNKCFWWALGLDQMAHHLTHYYIIWSLVS